MLDLKVKWFSEIEGGGEQHFASGEVSLPVPCVPLSFVATQRANIFWRFVIEVRHFQNHNYVTGLQCVQGSSSTFSKVKQSVAFKY